MMDVESSQRPIGSRTIFDDDRLAECGAELIGDDAANRVAGAARTKHGNDCDRPRRIIVGTKAAVNNVAAAAAKMRSSFFMRGSSLAIARLFVGAPILR
jgi:hypothetical protein